MDIPEGVDEGAYLTTMAMKAHNEGIAAAEWEARYGATTAPTGAPETTVVAPVDPEY